MVGTQRVTLLGFGNGHLTQAGSMDLATNENKCRVHYGYLYLSSPILFAILYSTA
jgi:hypothetical protein